MEFDISKFKEVTRRRKVNKGKIYCSINPTRMLFLSHKLIKRIQPISSINISIEADKKLVMIKKDEDGKFKVSLNKAGSARISFSSALNQLGIEVNEKRYIELLELNDEYFILDMSNLKNKEEIIEQFALNVKGESE